MTPIHSMPYYIIFSCCVLRTYVAPGCVLHVWCNNKLQFHFTTKAGRHTSFTVYEGMVVIPIYFLDLPAKPVLGNRQHDKLLLLRVHLCINH